ncbi:BamA/TamA family outer membrane protein [Flammeovirga kamogawensis]|uniref:BamA/TamA family outer membrane protein n=1 Tax=Flammeovirga kamogawensis TaxID=373891 RepID=A0ABX8GYZ6_9BACT|nr:BamA/TamA family outer membrane protein [Flammeovirga kamogawensis]MBB6459268.1 outer membrane protein assembly factor BamA [Flammeovirga kamogawensis]QWG08829.1 BamA/TamA family outer membrane protein [Flammeovirga kamogawensis]TRX67119.1 BamA/TamA family outer membrane protein [Flammeovirga kamogawensis]
MKPFIKTFLFFLFLISTPLFAQNSKSDSTKKEKNLQFIGIPNVANNKVFGWGGGANVGAFYKLNKADSISPPSMSFIQGMYFQNETWWLALLQENYYKQDKFRSRVLLFTTNVNFQFYTDELLPQLPSTVVPYSTKTSSIQASFSTKIFKDAFLGPIYTYGKNNFSFDSDALNKLLELRNVGEFTTSGIGLTFDYDSRDNIFSTSKGMYFNLYSLSYFDAIGSDADFTGLYGEYSYFYSIKKNMILASKANIAALFGDVPFIEENVMGFGGTRFQDLRGYNKGQFRGNQMYMVQTELRWRFYKNWGANFYCGMGTVFTAEQNVPFLPAGGLGLRYKASKQYNINVGIDAAWGKDDNGIYFLIGEAF